MTGSLYRQLKGYLFIGGSYGKDYTMPSQTHVRQLQELNFEIRKETENEFCGMRKEVEQVCQLHTKDFIKPPVILICGDKDLNPILATLRLEGE